MTDRVRITDVAPRDGLQNEAGVIATRDKARLVELLIATGVDEIEVTSFVSPKWVPQLADADELLESLRACPPPRGRGWGVGKGYAEHASDFLPGPAPANMPARDPTALARAQALRRAATGPERMLWSYLRSGQIDGLHFRRQHPFGPYILDFYCHEKRVAIELDGGSHEGARARARDAAREEFVRSFGVEVLRFTDDDVVRHARHVAERIRTVCAGRESLGKRVARSPTPQPLPLGGGPALSVLVPNEKGFERALALHSAEFPLKIAVFTAASETFSQRNTNASIDETIDRFRAFLPRAFDAGMAVRMYISCAIACPFEGPIAPDVVRRVADKLLALAPQGAGRVEIDLGDTIGVAEPEDIDRLLARFRELVDSRIIVLHLHDTYGRAAACVRRSLDLGVRSFDGSVAGLGGCPYAGTKERRAPGNIATETLVRTIHAAGHETGVDLSRLAKAAAFAQRIVAAARRTEAAR